jgi:hypothetical protein
MALLFQVWAKNHSCCNAEEVLASACQNTIRHTISHLMQHFSRENNSGLAILSNRQSIFWLIFDESYGGGVGIVGGWVGECGIGDRVIRNGSKDGLVLSVGLVKDESLLPAKGIILDNKASLLICFSLLTMF